MNRNTNNTNYGSSSNSNNSNRPSDRPIDWDPNLEVHSTWNNLSEEGKRINRGEAWYQELSDERKEQLESMAGWSDNMKQMLRNIEDDTEKTDDLKFEELEPSTWNPRVAAEGISELSSEDIKKEVDDNWQLIADEHKKYKAELKEDYNKYGDIDEYCANLEEAYWRIRNKREAFIDVYNSVGYYTNKNIPSHPSITEDEVAPPLPLLPRETPKEANTQTPTEFVAEKENCTYPHERDFSDIDGGDS